MLPLPAVALELAARGRVKLHRDGRVQFKRACYSAPLRLAGKSLWLKAKVMMVHLSLIGRLRNMVALDAQHDVVRKRYREGQQLRIDSMDCTNLYADDGRAERRSSALRAVALGRKSLLHFGSDSGGGRGAAIYALVATATLNGLDPEACLRHNVARIADHPVNRVSELLPWMVAD